MALLSLIATYLLPYLLSLAWLSQLVHAHPYLLPRSGPTTLAGGLTYHSARYEPLCGTLGHDAWYSEFFDRPESTRPCALSMETYRTTTNNFGLYDLTGTRLAGVMIGIGSPELCMCFTLRSADGAQTGDSCLYFDTLGRVDLYHGAGWVWQSYAAASMKEPLPQCNGGTNVGALERAWSETAVYPSATEYTRSVGLPPVTIVTTMKETKTETVWAETTLVPTMANVTLTRTVVTTDENGLPSTKLVTEQTQAPVVVKAVEGELSRSDKIALGIGLGIGIPSLLIGIWAGWWAIRKAQRERENEFGEKNLPPPRYQWD